MAKKKTGKPARFVSKQQLSTWERQKKRQRLIGVTGLVIIVAVLALVGVGWLVSEYQPAHEVVIRVNDTAFNMQYYIDMLALAATGQPAEYVELMTGLVAQDIVRQEIIKQGAADLGIAISNDKVVEELKKTKMPTGRVYKDAIRARLLAKRLIDEQFDPKVPTTADQRRVFAMSLESEAVAKAVRNRITQGESFADLAAQLSRHEEAKSNKGDFGLHPKEIFTDFINIKIPAEWAFSSEVGTLSQPLYDANVNKPVGYWLIKVLEREPDSDKAHVNAILVGSLEEANEVKARLEKGENFATVAREVSQLRGVAENGGDLGLVGPEEITPAFDTFAFDTNIPLNTLSAPIRDEEASTPIVYWLVKAESKSDNAKISDADRDQLKSKELEKWVADRLLDSETRVDDSNLTEEKKKLATLEVIKRMRAAAPSR